MVTREELHSTRGRSRLLFEMLDGHADSPVTPGWRSPEVAEALDLCLSCKGCKSDCPAGVDMASYKAEFLHQHLRGRLRPRSHYSMGWLPAVAALASSAPTAVNALTSMPVGRRIATWAGGIDSRRRLPAFAPRSFQSWARRHVSPPSSRSVLLWPDTFDNYLTPAVAESAVAVLEDAGYHVVVPRARLCCGLTWITTGQLGVARRVLDRTLDHLQPYLEQGIPVVGLEPSCTSVFRSDGVDLLAGDRRMERLRAATRTLAEVLDDAEGWTPPRMGRRAIVQTHCHQHAVLGTSADQRVMERAGIDATVLDSGCCGLAGNFGFEAGHYDVSRAIGERVLLPAVRSVPDDTVVLADGFSCRTQVEQGDTGREPLHLAELLAAGIRGRPPTVVRPRPPATSRVLAASAVGAALAGGALLGSAAWRSRR
jgi:Fe-S oxidoreductase